jgi:hypothetical protein
MSSAEGSSCEQNLLVVFHDGLEGAHRFFAADEQRHDHVRENNDIPQRQNGDGFEGVWFAPVRFCQVRFCQVGFRQVGFRRFRFRGGSGLGSRLRVSGHQDLLKDSRRANRPILPSVAGSSVQGGRGAPGAMT